MKKWRAVAVDDHPEILALYEAMLFDSAIELTGTAATGLGGIELVRREDPDLLILDLGMPDMDGLEVMERIAKLPRRPRIVVVSGFSRQQMERDARRMGADLYIEKGIPPKELVAQLEDVAARGSVGNELI